MGVCRRGVTGSKWILAEMEGVVQVQDMRDVLSRMDELGNLRRGNAQETRVTSGSKWGYTDIKGL